MYLTLNSPRPLYSSVLYTIPLGHFGLPCGSTAGKESTCGSGGLGLIPWVGKIPWRKDGVPTPVFWPGEFHGLYSSRGRKESDTTE